MATLYLIPTPIGRQKQNRVLPEYTLEVTRGLSRFVVENIRSAQSFLQWIDHPLKPYEPAFRILNRKTPAEEIFGILKLLREGDVGMMSEAGAPAVADPGATLVQMAHDAGHTVVPLTGPSSILLALMASGMSGQQFAFHGYLPIDRKPRTDAIRNLESESQRKSQTQIFIEAPFRNETLFESLLETCRPTTKLCIAVNLTLPDEQIVTLPAFKWKQRDPLTLAGLPAIYLMQAE